jgi:putative tricarboxylic transport membrane protein
LKKYLLADGLVWVLLGIGICAASMQLRLGDFRTPGAGFLPFLAGLLLGIFGLILMLSTLLSQEKVQEGEAEGRDRAERRWRRFATPAVTVVILFGYIVLLEPLGFLLTTFICLLSLFKLSEPERWMRPLFLACSVAVLSYLVFSVWLQCQLPKGLLKFW